MGNGTLSNLICGDTCTGQNTIFIFAYLSRVDFAKYGSALFEGIGESVLPFGFHGCQNVRNWRPMFLHMVASICSYCCQYLRKSWRSQTLLTNHIIKSEVIRINTVWRGWETKYIQSTCQQDSYKIQIYDFFFKQQLLKLI